MALAPLRRRVRRLGDRYRALLPPLQRWARPVLPLAQSGRALRSYPRFVGSWRRYARLGGAERLRFEDSQPCLFDHVATTPYDPHYLHQSVWAGERIVALRPERHVDVGSEVTFVGMLSTILPVTFVDIRPLEAPLANVRSVVGDLAERLPFDDRSVESLSCLHVAEHVGLGRYGDRLAPDGTRRACAELQRVLAPGGSLLFSVPVGRARVCFNAHRIHPPAQILGYFPELELAEFAFVGDDYRLHERAHPEDAAELSYGCGLFWLRRPA